MLKFTFTFCFIFLISLRGWSQSVQFVRAQVSGENVIINYDLNGESGQIFNIEIYSSHNNFTIPLTRVSGDAGDNIQAGSNKQIVWEAKKELKIFTGDISFEVKARSIYLPVIFTSPTSETNVTGGKSLIVRWRGGVDGEQLAITLLKDGVLFESFGNIKNTGSYTWAVPKKVPKSSNYKIRMVSSGRYADTFESVPFTLKKASKAWIYVLGGAVVVGGVAAAASGGNGNGNGGGIICDGCLPDPPGPPGN